MDLYYAKVRDVHDITRGHDTDAGIDMYIPNDFKTYELKPNESIVIPSGIKFVVPAGFYLFITMRSSTARKNLAIHAHVVDAGYDGEVHFDLHNVGNEPVTITPGMKIAQAILNPLPTYVPKKTTTDLVSQLNSSTSSRGTNGFGSTGE